MTLDRRLPGDGYHPDPEIDAEVRADALSAEQVDLAAGYPPRWWVCPDCGRSHHRGHFMTVGVHRCLFCGYVGEGGTMHTNDPRPYLQAVDPLTVPEPSPTPSLSRVRRWFRW